MPTDKRYDDPTSNKDGPPIPRHWLYALMIVDKVVDKFGIAFLILALLLTVVWKFGDPKTQNDFVRELLFQETTRRPWVTLAFLALVLLNFVGARANAIVARKLVQKEKDRVDAETERLRGVANEKSRLQEDILGVPLSHTDPDGEVSERKRVSATSTAAAKKADDGATAELDEASKTGRKEAS